VENGTAAADSTGGPAGAFDLFFLLLGLRERKFAVPAGKHRFNWSDTLIGSVVQQALAGTLPNDLILESVDVAGLSRASYEPIYGQELGAANFGVVQGHVRLTAIHYAFAAPDFPAPDFGGDPEPGNCRSFYLIKVAEFLNGEDRGVEWVPASCGGGDGYAGAMRYFGAEERQYRDHIFPLAVFGDGPAKLNAWLRGYVAYWGDMFEKFSWRADRDVLRNFELAHRFADKLDTFAKDFRRGYVRLSRAPGE
jgi:hypothetical protein